MRVTLLPQEGAGSQCIPSRGQGVLLGVCPWMGQGQPAGQQQEERRACSTDLTALAVRGQWVLQQVPQGQVSTVASQEQLELSPAACERQHRPSCQQSRGRCRGQSWEQAQAVARALASPPGTGETPFSYSQEAKILSSCSWRPLMLPQALPQITSQNPGLGQGTRTVSARSRGCS